MKDNRNMILAILLSALVLFGWSLLGPKTVPTATPQTVQVRNGKAQALPQPSASPGGAPASTAPTQLRARAAVLGSTPRVRIDTPSLAGSINLQGARIDDLVLLRQRELIDAKSPPVRLFSPAGAAGAYFAGVGWTASGIQVPGPDTVWQASSNLLQPGKPVTLSWSNPTGQRFELLVRVDDAYLFSIQQRVTNGGNSSTPVRPYGFASRAVKSPDLSTWTNHVGPISVVEGKANYDLDYANLDGQEPGFFSRLFGTSAHPGVNTFGGSAGWLGFTDKYWLAALAPNGAFTGTYRHTPNGGYQADYAGPTIAVAPGQTATTSTRIFAGAKEKTALDRYETEGIPRLSKSIDWGWFEWFMRPIFNLLLVLFKLTGNFGVAIICLTCIVRAIMFPIAQRQFKSGLAMRRVQPKLKALQERYKEDKPRQQQEIMKLYKDEKINPAGGCLPIFLQIPVFYALYKVLLVSVEMRHQPFALWIKDLSAPDPMTPVNLFGFLHFTPPHLLAIGVLPILVGFTQWLTVRMNPMTGVDPSQQQIMSMMPWFMIFVFAPFAAGLQLYYVMNNLLTLLQQWWFNRTHPIEAVPAKLAVAKR